jgi:hypothetical protein
VADLGGTLQCERPLASYIKVLIQAHAFLAVGMQRGAALVPEQKSLMWPCMYVAVGLLPPLDTDTSEGGRRTWDQQAATCDPPGSCLRPHTRLLIPAHTRREPDRVAYRCQAVLDVSGM